MLSSARRLGHRLVGVALALGAASLAFQAPARRVDVGGHRLRLQVAGRGTPTVVLDAGLGHGLDTWSTLWRDLASLTRVVRYDRAGLGRSEPGPLPRSSSRLVEELHALLAEAGEPGPFVLVGHSFGGLNALLFARRYPDRVAGLVLLEPTPPAFPRVERRLSSEADERRRETLLRLGPAAVGQELAAMEQSVAELAAAGPLPAVPILVLSAEREGEPERFREAWRDLQRELADSLGAEQVIVPSCGHYVHYDRPERVIEAIREVVERVRRQRSDAGHRGAAGR